MDHKRGGITMPSVHRTAEDNIRGIQVAINIQEDEDLEEIRKRKRHRMRRNSSEFPSMMTAPKHVHGGDWKDMLHLTDFHQKKRGNSTVSHSSSFRATRSRATSSLKGNSWIEHKLKKRECNQFVPTQRYSSRCGCGMPELQHSSDALRTLCSHKFLTLPGADDEATSDADNHKITNSSHRTHGPRWTIGKNTITSSTDAYGTIVFEGISHQARAQYVRTSFDTDPAILSHLFDKVWNLPPPKLVITIHGGLTNFELQPKLARIFRKGILKAARSTDAWIITSGLNVGVVRHVASALEDLGVSTRSRARVIAIGVAPWGILKRRGRFIGKDVSINYAPNQFNKSRLAELNDRHSYFLFSDNGTVGRYGAEIILRKRLETYLAQKEDGKRGNGPSIPVVCVVLEGGAFTIKVVNDYVTTNPRIPVVVCDGSGRAADLLAFTHHAIGEDGKLSDSIHKQLMSLIETVFNYDEKNAKRTVRQLVECAKQRNLMTIFRLGESQRQDVDHAILSALLKGQNLTSPEQLQLALAWNRADIARTEIFTLGTEWTNQDLHNAMMEALCYNRTDFVKLLLENGVSMHRFLTYGRLEHLYNTDKGPAHTLRSKLGIASKKHRLRLTEVGHAMEDLMGNAYKSNYTKDDFKAKYFVFTNRRQLGYRKTETERQRSENLKEDKEHEHSVRMDLLHTARNSIISIFGGKHQMDDDEDNFSNMEEESLDFTFKYPYSELLIWAVLTKRQSMAMLMWKHGEEAMAKSLVACRLYDALASDASQNYLELEICEELRNNSEEFRALSIEVLQYCCDQDKDMTLQLLTYELTNWGSETCLSLAALNNNRQFLAHPCCQLLLSDLWQGGLHIRNSANIKVLLALFMPIAIFLMEYKTKEEMMLQPHTAAEHQEENWETDSSISDATGYSDSSSSESEEDDHHDKTNHQRIFGEKDIMPLSFQQLMRDKLRFSSRHDNVINSSGNIVYSDLQNRTRSRTISVSKTKKQKSRNTEELGDVHDASENNVRVKRRSTQKHSGLYVSRPQSAQYNVEEKELRRRQESRSADITKVAQRLISWKRKVREFYSAPITTFWLWSLSFYVFLIALCYTLLLKTARFPSWVEWYVFFYIIVWMLEMFRKLVMIIMIDRKKPMWKKAKLYFWNYRNGILAMATTTYIIAFFIRLHPASRMVGRVLLVSNSVLWMLKLIDYMSVHRQLGPYITMASEMIPRMLPILAMLFVALLSFGLIREAITYPYEDWSWLLIRNIFYKPYYMLYGEVYAPEIDTCNDELWDKHIQEGVPINSGLLNATGDSCVPGYFVAPLFMTVFMLIANVLLMNTMVACCTYVFEQNVESTQEIWLFERYRQVMEYDSTPFIPPPFTIIYHVYWLIKWLRVRKRFFSRQNLLDASLKLFLSEEQVEKIHSFEEECVEDMEREKDIRKQSSNDERIHRTAERSEQILNRLNNLSSIDIFLKKDVRELESRMKSMENRHKEELEFMKQINNKLELLLRFNYGNYPHGSNFKKKKDGVSGDGHKNEDNNLESERQQNYSTAELSTTPSVLLQKQANTKHIRKSSAVPHIVFDLVDSGSPPKIQEPLSAPESSHEPGTESENELINTEIVPLPRMLGNQSRRGHNFYSSIADSILIDDDLYSDFPPLHFHYEPEPIISEESDSNERRMDPLRKTRDTQD